MRVNFSVTSAAMWTFQRSKEANAPICNFSPVKYLVLLLYFMSWWGWRETAYGITIQINAANNNNDKNDRDTNLQQQSRVFSRTCRCMEYWDCAARNGHPYSYCGISDTEVCCFVEETKKREENKGPKSLLTPLTSLTTTTTTIIPPLLPPPIPPPPLPSSPQIKNVSRSSRVKSQSRRRPHMTARVTSSTDSVPECGKQRTEGNLDNVANFMEWPWHVAILETVDDIYICGGSLISPNRVLTAAHCISSYVTKESKTRLKIRAGEFDVSTNSEPLPHTEVLVSMVAIHPQFNNSTLENDIGILGLSRDLTFADNIQPVCLPQNLDRPNPVSVSKVRRCVVTGWGRQNENTPHSVVLKEIVVPVWESVDCETRLKSTFGPQFHLPPSAVCAGDLKRDACDGDGGGPLVCWSKGKWIQEGIVSYGIGCGRSESPGIYSRTSWFLSWIDAFLHSGVMNSEN